MTNDDPTTLILSGATRQSKPAPPLDPKADYETEAECWRAISRLDGEWQPVQRYDGRYVAHQVINRSIPGQVDTGKVAEGVDLVKAKPAPKPKAIAKVVQPPMPARATGPAPVKRLGKPSKEIDGATTQARMLQRKRNTAKRATPPEPTPEQKRKLADIVKAGTPPPPTNKLGASLGEWKKRLRKVAWDWKGTILRGKVNLFVAEPGDGKTTTVHALLRPYCDPDFSLWPDGSVYDGPKGKAVIVDTEGLYDFWAARAEAWHQNFDWLIFPFSTTDPSGNEIEGEVPPINLDNADDLDRIVQNAMRPDVVVIVIDCLMSATATSFNDPRIRSVLQFLQALAGRTGKTIILIHHLRKKHEGDQFADRIELDRVMGSTAIMAFAKSIIGIDHPDKGSEWHRMYVIKSNWARKPFPALGVLVTYTGDDELAPQGVQFSTIPPERKGPGTPMRPTAYQQTILDGIHSADRESDGIVMREVVEALGGDRSNRTKTLKKLEHLGYLRRSTDDGKVRWSLTDEGLKAVGGINE